MKTERLLGIILLLKSRKKLSAQDIAKLFEVSERTIYRDINSLSLIKVPIVSLPGPGGGYSLMEGYKIDPAFFTKDEALSLFLGGRVAEQIEPGTKIRNALLKIESILPEEIKKEINLAKETVLFDMKGWFEKKPETYLQSLQEAITDKRQVDILYPNQCQLMDERRMIDSYGLIYKAGVWYLVAFCHLRKSLRTFRVDRIKRLELLSSNFRQQEGFDIAEYWKQTVIGYEEKKGEYPIKIRIEKKMANIVRRYIWQGEPVSNSDDGSLIWQMETDNFEYALAFTLSLGCYATVLEPDELKKKVIEEAKKIISLYKN
ncbi:MAG: YafY family protein [bacterium]|nr:YafY family protein [bacterium]